MTHFRKPAAHLQEQHQHGPEHRYEGWPRLHINTTGVHGGLLNQSTDRGDWLTQFSDWLPSFPIGYPVFRLATQEPQALRTQMRIN